MKRLAASDFAKLSEYNMMLKASPLEVTASWASGRALAMFLFSRVWLKGV